MTKLMEWLAVLAALLAVWVCILNDKVQIGLFQRNPDWIYWAPLIGLGLFGIYAASTVLYRTFTFNNCERAAVELKKEIGEARADLAKRGFVFRT